MSKKGWTILIIVAIIWYSIIALFLFQKPIKEFFINLQENISERVNSSSDKNKEVDEEDLEEDRYTEKKDRVFVRSDNVPDETFYNKSNISFNDVTDTDFMDISLYTNNIVIDLYSFKNSLWIKKDGKYIPDIAQEYKTALLRFGTLKKLKEANDYLMKTYGYKIKVLDAYRHPDMQQKLREHYAYITGGKSSNTTYVALPGYSNHQKGISVDITLVNMETLNELLMPSKYLEFSTLASAYPDAKIINPDAIKNVKILQEAMTKFGFSIYSAEWWHFDDKSLYGKVEGVKINPETFIQEKYENID